MLCGMWRAASERGRAQKRALVKAGIDRRLDGRGTTRGGETYHGS